MDKNATTSLTIETSVEGFFQGLVNDAVDNQHLNVSTESVCYLINLLSTFTNSEALFEPTSDGPMIQPLALLYGKALEAPNADLRNHTLKRLGDVALFISGIFTDSLKRKLVDVDYYIAMGGIAYGYLSTTSRRLARWQAYCELFDELATNFAKFVDILNEVGDQSGLRTGHDMMRLYEVWQRTGSKHAERQLQQAGIHPVLQSITNHRH